MGLGAVRDWAGGYQGIGWVVGGSGAVGSRCGGWEMGVGRAAGSCACSLNPLPPPRPPHQLHATFHAGSPSSWAPGTQLSPPRGGSTSGQHPPLHPHLHPPWPHRWVLGCPGVPGWGEWGSGDGCAQQGGVPGDGVGLCQGMWGGLCARPTGGAGQGACFEAVMGAACGLQLSLCPPWRDPPASLGGRWSSGWMGRVVGGNGGSCCCREAALRVSLGSRPEPEQLHVAQA